jgi:hypothetical protein
MHNPNKNEDTKMNPETPAVIFFSSIAGFLFYVSRASEITPKGTQVLEFFAYIIIAAVAVMKVSAMCNREIDQDQEQQQPILLQRSLRKN